MFLKPHTMIFLTFLTMGSLIAISSGSWFTAWLGLEINLMSMIPLILSSLNWKSTEASIKYFLIQAFASIIIIMTSISEPIIFNTLNILNSQDLILLALTIKIGMAPFHFWFPQVTSTLGWSQFFLMLTWQKVAPFIIISYFISKDALVLIAIASATAGAIGGLNQSMLKLILTYSSIAHSSWMLILSSLSSSMWMNYFLIYSSINMCIITSAYCLNLSSIKQINTSKLGLQEKYCFLSLILSLGGLPPFLGFYAKLTAIIFITKLYPIAVIAILISSSLVSLFYYMKITYTSLMISSLELKLPALLSSPYKIKMILSLAIAGNLVAPVMVLLT